MRKLTLIAIASVVVMSGATLPAFASLSDRDGTIWRQADVVQVAARGGDDKGGRNDGGRNNGGKGRDAKSRNDGKVIWRVQGGKHRPLWFFRHDRSPDCFTRKLRVENADGSVSTKSIRMCE